MPHRSPGPFDPAAVSPWKLGSGRRGVLLLHGFAGTPPELRRLGEYLAARGWRCWGPRLAGHGTSPEDLAGSRWLDWVRSARIALRELQEECDAVCIAGQSMGGTIALHLAATHPDVRAVATLAAPIWLSPDWRLTVLPLLHHVVRWHRPDPDDVDLADVSAVSELISYDRRATRSILELRALVRLVADELAMIRCPVTIFHGGGDRVIDPRNARDIERRLACSRAVERTLLPHSGHAISVDVDREKVNGHIATWFEQWTSTVTAERPVVA